MSDRDWDNVSRHETDIRNGDAIQVKIEREGVVLDVWTTEDNPETGHPEEVLVDSTYEFFAEMGMELVPIDEEDL